MHCGRERFPPQRLAGVLGGVCENREACPAGVGVHVNDLPARSIANLERRAAWISLNLNQPWSGLGADIDQRSAGIRPDDGANCRILQILRMEPGQLGAVVVPPRVGMVGRGEDGTNDAARLEHDLADQLQMLRGGIGRSDALKSVPVGECLRIENREPASGQPGRRQRIVQAHGEADSGKVARRPPEKIKPAHVSDLATVQSEWYGHQWDADRSGRCRQGPQLRYAVAGQRDKAHSQGEYHRRPQGDSEPVPLHGSPRCPQADGPERAVAERNEIRRGIVSLLLS